MSLPSELLTTADVLSSACSTICTLQLCDLEEAIVQLQWSSSVVGGEEPSGAGLHMRLITTMPLY